MNRKYKLKLCEAKQRMLEFAKEVQPYIIMSTLTTGIEYSVVTVENKNDQQDNALYIKKNDGIQRDCDDWIRVKFYLMGIGIEKFTGRCSEEGIRLRQFVPEYEQIDATNSTKECLEIVTGLLTQNENDKKRNEG